MGITIKRLRVATGLGFVSLTVHFVPFLFYGAHPLGYDTGFYRRYLIQPFVSFPNPQVPGLGTDALLPRLILDILHLLRIPPDVALYASYIAFLTLLPILFYYWLQPYLGTRGALIAGLLLILSPVGYTAFWYMLYKNAFALCLLILAFIAYERRAFWPLIALDVSIALSHKTSAIIYLATLCVLLLVDRKRWKEIALHGTATSSLLGLVWFSAGVSPRAVASGVVAVFLEWQDYLRLSAALIIASMSALISWRQLTVPRTLLAFTLATFAFPVFRLPFYQRIFVFTDVTLVAFATYGVVVLISRIDFSMERRWIPYSSFMLVCLIVGLHLGNLQARIRELQPLQSESNLSQITTIGASVPSDALLLTTNGEAPWYEGWTHAHIAAPGMLRDTYDFNTWVQFWQATSTAEQIAFLNSFPKPLYISTLGDFNHLIGNPIPCLTKVAPNLLRNDCKD